MRNNNNRLLLLFTETFSNGGIQRFNRTLVDACETLAIDYDVLTLRDSPDAVASYSLPPDSTIRAFRGRKVLFVLSAAKALWSRRHDIVLIGHINLAPAIAALLAPLPRSRGARIMLVAHGVDVWDCLDWGRRKALRRIDRILCVSRYTSANLRQQAPEIAPDRFTVFHNALNKSWASRFGSTIASNLRVDMPSRYMLSVTRLAATERYKGITTVLEAMRLMQDSQIHYVIAGGGDDIDYLRSYASQLEVADRVHFIGGVSDEELVSLYRQCELFVLPSGKEGFGIVFLEAMFFGAPVVAAGEKGALDVIVDGETGVLVPFGNAAALAAAVDRVLMDERLRESIRHQALKEVSADGQFTFKSFTNRWACAISLESP